MNLTEAKQILADNGYHLIKESKETVRREYNYDDTYGVITVSQSKKAGQLIVSILAYNSTEEFVTGVLPSMFSRIESEFDLNKISAQDYPNGSGNSFTVNVIYESNIDVDYNSLIRTIASMLDVF